MTARFDVTDSLSGALSLRAIKAFLAAAKCRSFTAAADVRCVTPAAISKQVRELEDCPGTTLFVRTGRAVTLTADGEMFKDAAQSLWRELSAHPAVAARGAAVESHAVEAG